MPPANSPSDTPTRRESTYPLDELAELAAPVPDLASTLMSQAEEEVNDDNVSFLRSTAIMSDGEEEENSNDNASGSSLNAMRRLRQMDYFINEQRRIQSERESARRLRRAVLRSGMSTASGQPLENESEALYNIGSASRDASQRSMGYQGWAPGTLDNEAEVANLTFNELRALARGHTRPSHNTATRRHYREEELGLSSGGFGRRNVAEPDEMDWQTSRAAGEGLNFDPSIADPSLRTTALLQSVRRHARFSSPRSWQPTAASDSTRSSNNPSRERDRASEVSRMLRAVPNRRDTLEDLRRGIYDDLNRARSREIPTSTTASSYLEEAIKYLERLRYCDNDSERLSFAEEGGFVDGSTFAYAQDPGDFILDTSRISPPARSSWLRAGAVFSGSQRSEASSGPFTIQLGNAGSTSRRLHNRTSSSQHDSSGIIFNRIAHPDPIIASAIVNQANRSNTSRPSPNIPSTLDDTWPVKVTITSIDHERMTLTGTMEAFNVPNKNSPHAASTIATFLEGEIIDFNRFTLETKSFTSDAKTDSKYWRELEPFKNLTDGELAERVVSRKWLSEELGGKFVLMRWKEKCFITPSDAQVHLTISGFYYVSLRREDGHVEGLYYDPSSSPYQHLQLAPANRDFPSFSFK